MDENLIAKYIHNSVHSNEYCIIIDLNINKKYFKGKMFLYDIDLISRHTDYYKVNLYLKLLINSDFSYSVYGKYNQDIIYKSDKIKIAYNIVENGDELNLKVYINNNNQTYVYWTVKPNFISNVYAENSLLVLNNDIIKSSSLPSTSVFIEEFNPAYLVTNYIKTNSIGNNSAEDNNLYFENNIIPKTHANLSLGRPDKSFDNLWLSQYVKIPNQTKDNVKTFLNNKNVTKQSSIMFCNSQKNKALNLYNQNDDKLYDIFGVAEDKQQESFTPEICGATTKGVITYTEQTGKIIRVGKLCIVNIRLRGTVDDTIDGSLYIQLPLTNLNYFGGANIYYQTGFKGLLKSIFYNNNKLELKTTSDSSGDSMAFNSKTVRGNTLTLYCLAILQEK